MVGSLIAGVEESPGETIILKDESSRNQEHGSIEAIQKVQKIDITSLKKKISANWFEEFVGRVPYKGTLSKRFINWWEV